MQKVFSMAKSKRIGKLRIVTLLLAFLMLLSFGVFALSACSTSEEEDDSSSETRTDTQTFSNADFEYFSDSDGSYVIGSADNWTSSAVSNDSGTSASSSSAKSGIVDTAERESAFDETSYAAYVEDPENSTFDWSGFYYAYKNYIYYDGLDEEDDADELEDAKYFTDIDNYYDIPGWDLFAAWIESDEGQQFLTDNNIDPDDFSTTNSDDLLLDAVREEFIEYVRGLNPGTHWTGSDDEATLNEEKGTHVLMLHNYRTNGYGTAMQYASTSITLSAGTAASVSVWVKTSDLTYNDGTSVAAGNRGAFIEISNSVGGTSQDPLVVRNINTEIQNPAADENTPARNNGWVEYTFYIRASSYATTTFTVNLGLGRQAAGNTANYYDYVQGYAFFDDLTYTVFEAKDWDTTLTEAGVSADNTVTLDTSSLSDEGTFNAQGVTSNLFALDLDELTATNALRSLTLSTDATSGNTTIGNTTDDRGNTVESYFYPDRSLIAESDLTNSDILAASAITGGSYAQALKDALENYSALPFADSDILLLYSSQGAPYTATVDDDLFTVTKGRTLMISFWVKTSDLQGGTGATVTLVDGDTDTAIGAVDTTTLETVDIKDDTSKTEDIFDGWQYCAFYVTTEEEELSFTLEFSFGATTIAGTTLSSYVPGFAMFAGFETCSLTEEQAALASTGDYAKTVTLTGDKYADAPAFDTPATNDKSIETGIADPSNYTGVYGGSYHVGGSDPEANNAKNDLATAGLISKEYAGSYLTTDDWFEILTHYNGSYSDVLTAWNEILGSSCTQPLIIAKTVADSYGFIANSTSSVSADSYTQITVRVKLSPHTRAYVYLIDTTEPDITDPADEGKLMYSDTLKHETGVSYRYDEDGNLINLDPDDENYDRRDNTLLYYQDNGLWAKERNYTGTEFYANLSNYDTDEDGNLTDASGNIVYYLHDGAFYRYCDEDSDTYEVQVKDFTEAGIDLTGAKLQDTTEQDLFQMVENDTDQVSDWIYIRFFIANGSDSKTYRLEYWSGDRNGTEGSVIDAATNTDAVDNNFVIFDVVQYSDLAEESFNNLVDAQMESLAKDLGYADTDALEEAYLADPSKFTSGIETDADGSTIENAGTLVYYHYSLFDDSDYAPFDADRTDGDDPYSGYDPTTYSNTVAYLKYSFADSGVTYYDTYINFAASEETVSSSSSDDSTSDDTTTPDSNVNVWLLISSILLAAVLVITLLALLLRKLLAGMKRKGADKASPMYSNKRDIYIRKLKKAEAEEREEEAEEEEDLFTDAELYNETEETDADADADTDNEDAPADDNTDSSDEGKTE